MLTLLYDLVGGDVALCGHTNLPFARASAVRGIEDGSFGP